ncbi:MAG: MBL fold metallo-hydrolase [Pseudomonadota bacterium]
MRILKWLGGVLIALVVLIVGFLTYLIAVQADPGDLVDLIEAPDVSPPEGAVTAQFLGNSNLLFSDGETSILIDGWFTRPSTLTLAFGEVEPDIAAIDAALARAGVDKLDAVIPAHSHFDHAMDSPIVAEKTGALMVGTRSSMNIALGLSYDMARFREVGQAAELTYGAFKVTLIKSVHFHFPAGPLTGGDMELDFIIDPLVPPAPALDYKMGGAYSILIEHPEGTALLQASAGFIPGLLEGRSADIVFLGVGALMSQEADYLDDYWRHVVGAVSPQKIYPIHYDSFTHTLGETPEWPNLLLDQALGQHGVKGVRWVTERAGDIAIGLMPMWDKIAIYRRL